MANTYDYKQLIKDMPGDLATSLGVFMDNKRTNGYDAYASSLGGNVQNVLSTPLSSQSIADMFSSYGGVSAPSYNDVRGSSALDRVLGTMQSAAAGAASGMSHGNWMEAAIKAGVNTASGIAGSIIGNRQARRTYGRLNELATSYNTQANEIMDNKTDDYNRNKALNALRSLANGGFTNGVRTFETGGSHESNPYGGIQVGTEPDGTRDMVEQGETEVRLGMNDDGTMTDYVFSNNTMPEALCRKHHVKKGTSFSECAKQIQKESEERPNDPIAINGLKARIGALMEDQESFNRAREERALDQALSSMSGEDKLALLTAMSQVFRQQEAQPQQDMADQNPEQQNTGFQPQDMEQMMYRCGGRVKRAKEGDIFHPKVYRTDPYIDDLDSRHYLIKEPEPYNNGYTPSPVTSSDKGDIFHPKVYRTDPYYDALDSRHYLIKEPEPYNNGYTPFPVTSLDISQQNAVEFLRNYNRYKESPVNTAITGLADERDDDSLDTVLPEHKTYYRDNLLRYATPAMSAYQFIKTMAQKPDYSRANKLIDAANSLPSVSYRPTGTLMSYRPDDTRAAANDMNAMNMRRLAMLAGTGNRQAAMAGVLANNMQYQNAMSRMNEENARRRLAEMNAVISANNAVQANNAKEAMSAESANISRALNRAGLLEKAYRMMDAYDNGLSAARSAATSNLTANLQNVALQRYRDKMLELEALAGNFRTLNDPLRDYTNTRTKAKTR